MECLRHRSARLWHGRGRRRAVTLVEAVLYLTVTLSVLLLTTRLLDQESERRDVVAAAADFNQMFAAAQMYTLSEYSELRDQVIASAAGSASDHLIMPVTTGVIADAGLLPELFDRGGGAGLGNLYGKTYTLWVRGVLRSDADEPQKTVKYFDHLKGGAFDPELTDGVYEPPPDEFSPVVNDELDLEIVLVTDEVTDPVGSRILRPGVANQIAVATGKPNAGVLVEEESPLGPSFPTVPVARGAYGAWEIELARYVDDWSPGTGDPEFPRSTSGREANLAAIVALSRYGLLTSASGPRAGSATEELQRCEELAPGTPQYQACIEDSALYRSILFKAWDVDGDGNLDQFPGLEDVSRISMADPAASRDSPTDAVRTIGRISGLTFLEMRAPYSSGLVTDTVDVVPTIAGASVVQLREPLRGTDGALLEGETRGTIRNLHGLSCAAGGRTAMDDGRMTVDCGETWFSSALVVTQDPDTGLGTLALTGDAAFAGDVAFAPAGPDGGSPELRVGTDSAYATVSGDELRLQNDAGDYVEVIPSVVTASGRLRADQVVIGGVSVGDLSRNNEADAPDVTENLLIRTVTGRISTEGSPAVFAMPRCGDFGEPYLTVIAVNPPATHGAMNLIRGVSTTTGMSSAGGSYEVDVSVDYARAVADGATCERTWFWLFDWLNPEIDCTYTNLRLDPATISNPQGTTVTAVAGCEP
jgi:hypothetical protein